jgi:dienelactone hydrolase
MKRDIEFKADDGITLRGWIVTPDTPGPHPVVVMTHGAGGYKEWHLPGLSAILQAAGFASLAYDHRNFGDSEGQPRCEIMAQRQIEDYRTAITFAETQTDLDCQRLGIFGTSFSGGHVLVVAAIDRRVKCVVAQVPFISGSQGMVTQFHPEEALEMQRRWDQDRRDRAAGKPPQMVPHYVGDPNNPVAGRSANRVQFFQRMTEAEKRNWTNQLTLRSMEQLYQYEAGSFVKLISPTPLLMIVSHEEVRLMLPFYEEALEPKKVVLTKGGHYDPYMDEYPKAAGATRDWFVQWLGSSTEPKRTSS